MEKIISCCGVICSECQYFPKECSGCPTVRGHVFWLEYTGEEVCEIYKCCVNEKNLAHCGECEMLPCDNYNGSDPTKTKEENENDFIKQLAQLRVMKS
ncbi:DUF3795 domain-containing protein [Clostridium sp. AF15-17LB]|nr:DUF3795 domain-containing protein [Clostridium sp. AF15-17LB]